MTADKLGGVVRAIAGPVLAYFVGKGVIGTEHTEVIIVALTAVATAAWSIYAKREA